MCIKVVEENLSNLSYVPDHLKTQEMCIKAVEKDQWLLEDVPDNLRHKKCVMRQLSKSRAYWSMSLAA